MHTVSSSGTGLPKVILIATYMVTTKKSKILFSNLYKSG